MKAKLILAGCLCGVLTAHAAGMPDLAAVQQVLAENPEYGSASRWEAFVFQNPDRESKKNVVLTSGQVFSLGSELITGFFQQSAAKQIKLLVDFERDLGTLTSDEQLKFAVEIPKLLNQSETSEVTE